MATNDLTVDKEWGCSTNKVTQISAVTYPRVLYFVINLLLIYYFFLNSNMKII